MHQRVKLKALWKRIVYQENNDMKSDGGIGACMFAMSYLCNKA